MTTRLVSLRPANSVRGRVGRWILCLGLIHFGAILTPAQGSRPDQTPVHFDGALIPPPPQQGSAWEAPPTKLPRFLVNATADLFNAGMADPRRCDYRAVEIGDDASVATHGFVFHDPDHPDRRFVVGWDALIYPALQVGDAADLAADMTQLADTIQEKRAAILAETPGELGPFEVARSNHLQRPTPHLSTLATVTDASSLKICLLLRLGRADLAERLCAAGTSWTPDDPRSSLTRYGISLYSLAFDWSDRAYARAVEALVRADDVVALETARRLQTFVDRLEPRLDELSFPRTVPTSRNLGSSPHFANLRLFRGLLADLERRSVEPPRAPIPGPDAPTDVRVAALIHNLDQITSLRQIRYSPRSRDLLLRQALIAAGDAAVEPLLAAFESDDRLTRYFAHGETFESYGSYGLVSVHEVARSLLLDIFQTKMIPGATETIVDGDAVARRSQADAMRVFWAKNRSLSELDRLYRTLDDPQALTAEWIDAAEKLTKRDDRDPSSAMKGEPLRSRTNPSVTELLARRIEAIDPADSRLLPDPDTPFKNSLETANQLARLLATWDRNGAIPALRSRVKRTTRVVSGLSAESSKADGLKGDIADFTVIRHRAGDPTALDDYAAWVVTTTPNRYDKFSDTIFGPLCLFADHPTIQRASVALFDNPRSPWVPLFRRGDKSGLMLDHLVSGPMLGVAPFRKLVRAGLDDQTVVGSVTTDPKGEIEVKIGNEYRCNVASQTDSPRQPDPGTSQPIRVADLHLWKLGVIDGLPAIQLWWPLAERDRLIAVAAATLDHYGLQFRERLEWADRVGWSGNFPLDPSSPTFDRLDHPATRAEFEAGQAIFHLEGAEVRVWPLADYPTHARWTTRPVPIDDPTDPRSGESMTAEMVQNRLDTLREAWIWQAEEVRVGDHWQRYFGLVDRDQFARVPAEDVELLPPAGENWRTFANDFDANLTVDTFVAGLPYQARIARPGESITVEFRIRNHRGITVDAPTDWFRTAGGFSIARGVGIRLYYRDQAYYSMDRTMPYDREIPARPVTRHEGGIIPLEPIATTSLGHLNLRDLFLIDQVGWYRVVFTPEGRWTDTGAAGMVEIYLEVRPASDSIPKP